MVQQLDGVVQIRVIIRFILNNYGIFVTDKVKDDISFSEPAVKELGEMFDLVEETYSTSIKSLKTKNKDLAKVAEKLEDDVDDLERKLKISHVDRVRDGVCRPEADQIFIETLRNLERISDHADNIAYDVIMDT